MIKSLRQLRRTAINYYKYFDAVSAVPKCFENDRNVLQIDYPTYLKMRLMPCLWSGPGGFKLTIGFFLRRHSASCTVESLSLFYLLLYIFDLHDDASIS